MKRVYKNHATKIRLTKVFGFWTFFESHIKRPTFNEFLRFKTYKEAYESMQRYSKKYYGEKAL